jgi:hypothetical protein
VGLTATIDQPDFPDGYEFGVEGLGILKNREATEISEEREEAYAAAHGQLMQDAFAEAGNIKIEGSPIVTEIPEVHGTEFPTEEAAPEAEAESAVPESQEEAPKSDEG